MTGPGPIFQLCAEDEEPAPQLEIRNARRFVVGVEQKVPILGGRTVDYVNFDNAATTPPLTFVLECSRRFFDWYASVHRGSGLKSLVSTHIYEKCRRIVGEFVGADPSHHTVIFTQNATAALNKLAARLCISGRQTVLTTTMEHHSNLLPWRRIGCNVQHARVNPADGSLRLGDIERRLRRGRGRVDIVSVSGASNVTGHMPPVRHIARLAHEHGAMLAVDATQLVPHRPVRMGAPDDPERFDFIVFSGHKMYAPFGCGALVGPRAVFEEGPPDTVGGGTVNMVSTDDVMWAPPPEKEEAGTPNVPGAVALACAARVLRSIGMENVAEHERELTRRALRKLGRLPGLTLYGERDPELGRDRLGVITMNVRRLGHGELAAALGHEWGIGVRNGCFCAQPYVRELMGVSDREMKSIAEHLAVGDHTAVPGMVRVSFGLYSTPDEVDYFVDALASILSDGPRSEYVLDEHYRDYVPDPPLVDLDDYSPF
ncbi:MAG: aminotransferase class V-fold PLP-dependent enzyme [Planctomycetota bacterium]